MASGKPLQLIYDSDQKVLHATVAQVVPNGKPEFGPLVGRGPQAQNLRFTFWVSAKADLNGIGLNLTAFRFPDIDFERVEENDGKHQFQGTALPIRHVATQPSDS